MAGTADDKRGAYVEKARDEVARLEAAGARLGGNAFSPLLFVKGEPNAQELAGGAPLCGADGNALRAAIAALGYAPQDWCALLTVDGQGRPLSPAVLRRAVAALSPTTVVAVDDAGAAALREAFASELVELEDLGEALLQPGKVAQILDMRVLALGGFEAALGDQASKAVMWSRLKLIPPEGAPY